MESLKAVLFGIVEGITEWLPISSTGHMILLEEIMPFCSMRTDFFEVFLVVIQLGAILAVVLLYWDRMVPLAKNTDKFEVQWKTVVTWVKVAVACVPAVPAEILMGDAIEEKFYHYRVVACMLIVVGVWFLLVEGRKGEQMPKVSAMQDISFKTAFYIGMFQVIAAVFPGTSRSGATILGALLLGVSRTAAAEFTFFLAVPVMLGASVLKIVQFQLEVQPNEVMLLVLGMAVAFATSILVIRFLMGYIQKHDFKTFGYYRILLGVVVFMVYPMLR